MKIRRIAAALVAATALLAGATEATAHEGHVHEPCRANGVTGEYEC